MLAVSALPGHAYALVGSYVDAFAQRVIPIAKALNPQSIVFGALPDRSLGTPPFAVGASSSSGLPINFASLTAPVCTVNGATVTLVAVGTCTVRASQAGNATYAAAPNVDQSFRVVAAPPTISFAAAEDYAVGGYPESLALGDFNGDGIPDLAVADPFSSSVSILIGRSDGTFTSGASVASGGTPIAVATGDFNGDGKLDLAICDFTNGTVVIFAGNGNGTFSRVGAFTAGLYPDAIAVADLNRDGKLDLVVTNGSSGGVTGLTTSVLMGNGDGTFRLSAGNTTGVNPYAVVVGDFNADGKPDLAIANPGSNTVSILKGNGDGTFALTGVYPVGSFPDGLALGDFNGDGNIDLAVVSNYSSNVSILLGHGDGTFALATNFTTGYGSASVAVADFNGDGRADLAVVNRFDNNVVVLFGNGNGSFQMPVAFSVGAAPSAVLARDLNGDGKPDLVLTSAANNTVSVLLQTGATPATLVVQSGTPQTATVNTPYLTPLAVVVRDTASLPLSGVPIAFAAPASGPSGTFGAAGPFARVLSDASGTAIAPAFTASSTAGSFSVIASVSTLNAVFALTNTASSPSFAPLFTSGSPINGTVNTPYSFTVAATGTPAPAFSVLANSLPMGLSLNGATGLIAGTPSAQGAFAGTLTASNGVPPNATQPFVITIGGMTQTISFAPLGDKPLGTPPLTLSATASSGLAVTFASQTDGICSVGTSQVTLIAIGTCTIRATQGGNDSYGPAVYVDRSFQVTAANQSPTVLLRSPTNNTSYVMPAMVPLYAVASDLDGVIARVEFYNGSALLGTSGQVPYTFIWSGVSAGSYVITARAYDNLGASTTSAVANITVNATAQQVSFIRSSDVLTNNAPVGIVVGDFNADAKLDIALPHASTSVADVALLRGDGGGGFLVAGDYFSGSTGGAILGSVAADFNRDGNLDLASVKSAGVVAVQLGNAAGTLANGVNYPVNVSARVIASGDFDGDGKVDLVTANNDGSLSMLIGNGDGTFRSTVNLAVGAVLADSLAVADFNGDGKLDIVQTQSTDQSILILLGNGNGTFRPAARIPTGAFPSRPNEVVVGDFNGDGKVDIAFSNLFNPNVSVLLGNGDGTFQPTFDYPTGAASDGRGIVAVDVDGDGKLDLVLANVNDNAVAVLLGNGNGSFQAPVTIAVGAGPFHIAAGDFNGDGAPDIAVAYTTGTTISIVTNASKLVTRAPTLTNGRPPDGEAGVRYDFNFTATGVPGPVFALRESTFFATMQPNGLLTTGVPGSSGCPCPGLYSGTAIASNGVAPDASQAFSILIRRANQTITFNPLPDLPVGATSFLDTKASSNGTVTLSSLTPDICSLDTSSPPTVVLKALRPGSCTIRAEQAGSGYFAPAPSVDRTFSVSASASAATFSVAISSPPDGADFVAPGTVVLKALVSNGYAASHVQQVDYYHDGSIPIGTATMSPYAITWSNVSLGTHVLMARATLINDLSGLVAGYADAPPITIAVTASADQPVVTLTAPSAGSQFVAPATIGLVATTTDAQFPITRVEFYRGGTLLGSAAGPPYTLTWGDIPGGTFALTARAVNAAGAATTSPPVVISVDAGIAMPVASYGFDDAWISTGYIQDLLGGFDGIPQGNVAPVAAGGVGVKPDTCQAASFAGGVVDIRDLAVPLLAGSKTTVAFWMNWNGGDGAMPVSWSTQGLMFSAGGFGFTTLNSDVYGVAAAPLANSWHHVVAEFTNGSVAANRLYVDGVLQSTTQRVGVPNNSNAVVNGSLRIGGRSNASDHRYFGHVDELWLYQGMLSTTQVGEIYSAANPCVPLRATLAAPLKGAEYSAPARIELVATAVSRQTPIARVDFYNGAALIGSATSVPYVLAWANVPPGSFNLTVKAIDTSGVSATSPPVAVTVVARAPDVQLSAPAAGAIFSKGDQINLTATASETGGTIARVDFMAEGNVIGSRTQPPYQLAWNPPPAAFNTSYDLTASATDARGASTTTLATRVSVITDEIAVNLTAPANNATYASPTTVTLSATAIPIKTGDTTARVDFYSQLGSVTQQIGSATTPPYVTTWSGFGAGAYNLYAKASGSLGTAGSSQVVRVNVIGDQSPSIALTSPANGAQFTAPATIPLAASASDPDGMVAKVEFYSGTTLLGTRTSPPYSMSWSPMDVGSYALAAKATDNLGVSNFSGPVNVTVSASVAPSVTITVPQNGAQYAVGQAIVLTASASTPGRTIDRVEFYVDAALLRAIPVGGGLAAANVGFSWLNASLGAHAITAKVVATDGTNAASAAVNIAVADLSVTLATPFSGQVYQSPEDVRITALPIANGSTISQVDFIGDGVLLGSVKAPPYSFLWSGVKVGAHTVSATVRTAGGLAASSGSSSISVVTTPTLAIDAGIDGSTIADDNVSISGILQAATNSAVSINGHVAALDRAGRFYVDGVPLQPGSNTLTLLVHTQDAAPVTKTIVVSSSGQAPFAVDVTPLSGLAPLGVQLTITNRGSVSFQRIEIDGNSDGAPELTLTGLPDNTATVSLSYTNPGLYGLRVTVFDASNHVIYTATRKILARDPRDLAGLVTQVFSGMLDRLHSGNVTGALTAITTTVRSKYQNVFSSLGARLPSILDGGFGVVTALSVTEEFADITVVRTKPDGQHGYHALVIQDGDGLWRIDNM